MRQAAFEERYAGAWDRFERWLDRHDRLRKRKSDAENSLIGQEVPGAYRRICQLLALARERQYSPDLIDRLNRLALRGHHLLYGSRGGQSTRVLSFIAAEFPRLVRAEWKLVAASALLFMGTLVLLFAVILAYPDFIHYFIDPRELASFEEMYNPSNPRLGMRASDDNVMMFAFYIWNNVRIGFQVFATGVTFGLGTVFFLVFNGALIGAVAGHLTGIGYGAPFWSFVSGHSAMELTAIVIAGAAGLRLGGAVISPGGLSRKNALVQAARPAVRLVYGAALMFTIAAFIEGFWSPLTLFPAQTKHAVGGALWGFLFLYLALAGRRRAA
jgi:uncharacterized membrane protein SpoIIM required for sporulation